jgi:hypothetical protein
MDGMARVLLKTSDESSECTSKQISSWRNKFQSEKHSASFVVKIVAGISNGKHNSKLKRRYQA